MHTLNHHKLKSYAILVVLSLQLLSHAKALSSSDSNRNESTTSSTSATIVATNTTSIPRTIIINNNSHVPLLLSNISLSAVAAGELQHHKNQQPTPTNDSNQHVPLRKNATPTEYAAGTYTQQQPQQQQQQQTPVSVFFANYNNQQKVLQLAKNIEERLRSIRNDEMLSETIQEIFDSMHVTSSNINSHNPNCNTNNNTNSQNQNASAKLTHDLQLFSKRLTKKLQNATHIVLNLRDFFRYNITKLFLQRSFVSDYNDDEDSDPDFDTEIDEFDGNVLGATSSTEEETTLPYSILQLRTTIQACQMVDYAREPQNYNKQQIQILNYLKTEHEQQQLNENNERSLEANAYVAEKIQTIKSTLMERNIFELPNATTCSDSKQQRGAAILRFHLKHIFFLSRADDASGPSERYYYDMHFRYLYAAAIRLKYVFLLIDVGSAMNADLLELTKSYVSNVLQLLSDTDLISIVTIADEAKTMYLDTYTTDASKGIYPATRAYKEEILNYVNNLGVIKAHTNHSLGFEYAFNLLYSLQDKSYITVDNPIQFIYITRGLLTRGLLTNPSDGMHVLQVIAQGQQKLLTPIRINVCAVVLDEKRIMYEKQFLTDIATQNYTKFNIKVGDWYTDGSSLVGKYFMLTKMQPASILRASTAIFGNSYEKPYLTQSLEVHPPVVDAYSKDAIVSITHAVPPFGLVGVNLYLSDLIEDVIGYRQPTEQQQNSNKHDFVYAFLIDRKGLTIAHPAFPRPLTQSQTPFPVDIGFLENSTDFDSIRREMLHADYGKMNTTVFITNNQRTELMTRTYEWQSVLDIYIICLVSTNKRNIGTIAKTTENSPQPQQQVATSMPSIALQRFKDSVYAESNDYEYLGSMDLLYHRLDLKPPTHAPVCRYFRQVATFDTATLFLSASAFESPFSFLHNNRMSTQHTQTETVESIMAYLKDSTGFVANIGLRGQIRHEVTALYNAMQHLKKRHQDKRGRLKNYIIRRYIATVNGILQVYPGCLLSNAYDPARRPWFQKAMQHPGKIISTEPYLDAGGAGYIVTIAHTIFEGKANALHSVRDQPIAVVALDFPYAYYYKMILDTTPLCQANNIKCLLFENEGYLIAHPSMLEPSTPNRNTRRPHEHLTHKESYLANDILNHKSLVKKLACANYQNRTLQRYYVFNTSLTDILTNVVHQERTKYAIALVRGSNIFAALLNSTCEGGAFCPCSTIDRICLNCNRMDQMDCECPCECPMEVDVFVEMNSKAEQVFGNYTQNYAYCEPPSEHFIALPTTAAEHSLFPACMSINCDVYGTQQECLAVMGCEWCQQDVDGNAFAAAFCASQSSCFNGVLSSISPYGDFDDVDIIAAHGFNPGQKPNSYSAFGPVGGAIVVLGIVIGFAIYCYRYNLDAHAHDQFYIDSMQEENYGLPLSRFNFDDCQAHDEPPGGAGYDHPSAQRNLMHPADISPYHVSTGSSYRRPPNGESDHGYSTMTPHEDSSDHQCFTLAEPLLLNDKRHSKSDTVSISTSISSPTNRHHQQPSVPQFPHLYQGQSAKDARYNLTSPKKYHSPARVYEQTTLPLHDCTEEALSPHFILAPVTVHRHMETSES